MQCLLWTIVIITVGIMIPPAIADADLVFDADGYNKGEYGPNPHQYYYSTDITSPLLLVNHWDPSRTENTAYIFLTLDSPEDGGKSGPVIYRADDLSLVYSDLHWSAAHNAHVGQFNGDDYLVFIEQYELGGGPSTRCLLYDSTYSLAYNISSHGTENASIELHECQLTRDGSVVVILKEVTPFDLSAVGGPPDGEILDNIVQEIDIETGALLWTWRGSEHYNISSSYIEYRHGTGPYDYMHMNSADKTAEGNFLISARHTHSVILVDPGSGDITWTLGGKRTDFSDISTSGRVDFAWQHHARLAQTFSRLERDDEQTNASNPWLTLTLFDNHNISGVTGCTANCSRGKRIELLPENRTARLVSEFYHPDSLVSRFEGSYQTLRSGNVFLGWGANPTFTEYTPEGDCVLDVQFNIWRPERGYPVNYRAFKMDWKAFPTWDPAIVVLQGEIGGECRIYVSWNGATEVYRWQLIVGLSYDNVTESTIVVSKIGFETEIPFVPLSSSRRFLRAAALDKGNNVLGLTAIVELPAAGES